MKTAFSKSIRTTDTMYVFFVLQFVCIPFKAVTQFFFGSKNLTKGTF